MDANGYFSASEKKIDVSNQQSAFSNQLSAIAGRAASVVIVFGVEMPFEAAGGLGGQGVPRLRSASLTPLGMTEMRRIRERVLNAERCPPNADR
jgi:hypothetical protein